MSTRDKLNAIAEMNQSNQRMGPSAVKDKQASELYNQMINYQQIAEEAPVNAANAEQRYYMFVDGDYIDNSLVRTAPNVKRGIEKTHEVILNTVTSSIDNYESQRTYIKNISDVFSNLQEKITHNIKVQDNKLADNTTNRQKVYYLNQEYETLDNVNYILFLAGIGFIGLALDSIYEEQLWNKMNQLILSVIFILFILFIVSKWFDNLMIHVMALLGVISSYRPIIYATF